jgi:4-hydroxybenzoate polyprenyltransferase
VIRFFELALLGRISRPANLLIATLTYTLAAWLSFGKSLAFLGYGLYYLQGGLMLLIMASGYWINDVFDYKIDRINKPHRVVIGAYISAKKVLSIYWAVILGCTVASLWLPPKFLLINLVATALLFLYALRFKRAAVVGNLIVATLTSLVVFAGAWLHNPLRISLLGGMAFAFLVTLLREITKDVEDLKGDIAYGLRTLPAVIGIRPTRVWLVGGYGLLVLACNLPVVFHYGLWGEIPWLYWGFSVVAVQLPLGYLGYKTALAVRTADFARLSLGLKLVILPGLLSLLLLA